MKIKDSFLSFLFWMLVFGLAVRCFEWAMLSHYQEQTWMQLGLCLKGFCYDILFFSKVALVLFPIHWLIYRRSHYAAAVTFRILGTLMLLISNAMIMYYVSADIPLDKVFFTYSIKVLIYISKSTGAFVWWGYAGLLLIPALFFVVSKKKLNFGKPWLFVWLGLAVAGFFFNGVPAWMYGTNEEKNTICNKQEYFWTSLIKRNDTFYRFDKENLDPDRVKTFQSNFSDVDFVDYKYPFCHTDRTADVLSDFFDLKQDTMPNLVFIISEGLGRSFSGPDSRLPSATPFLDSLANTGLYWTNCISSSQRTFAVLPTMFGNLPFGQKGFMQSMDMPRFQSLVDILQDNGYRSSFFYGGWLCFDDMCYFLKDMGIKNYLPEHNEYPEKEQNTWGLYDHVLFREALKMVAANQEAPRLDIYLTLTTHDPFEYPDKTEYTKAYGDKLVQANREQTLLPHLYERYASFLYYDDCLRKFFSDYSRLPSYENTIFIITGDHDFYGLTNEMERCHVPLVVWSPMLKASCRFPALVSHRDITPSVLALIKNNYEIQSPEIVNWINTGLDTVTFFRSKTFTPQANASHQLTNMVFGDLFVVGDVVFRFVLDGNRLDIKPINNTQILDFVKEYKALDDYVMSNDALLPLDSGEIVLLKRIEEDQSVNFTLTKSNTYPLDTLGRNCVFKLSKDFPLNTFVIPFENDLQSVFVHLDCDLYIPSGAKGKTVGYALAVIHKDRTRELLRTITINHNDYSQYDGWSHFKITQSIDRSTLSYRPGDELTGYFVNQDEQEFYLTGLTMTIVGNLKKK